MRYKIILSYLGTRYAGWQKQPGDKTVQQTIEDAFSTILRQGIELTGCGRTDAGVHARNYVAHTDLKFEDISAERISKVIYQLNAILPRDIVIHQIAEIHPEFHARFDAKERTYRYYMHFEKDPFKQETSFYFQQSRDLDVSLLQEAAKVILKYNHFKPFCKTGSDADHYRCNLFQSDWQVNDNAAIYKVSSNRFLRGMVRLLDGACLNVGLKKISLDQLIDCMEKQSPVPQAWSVPAEGLFLEEIKY